MAIGLSGAEDSAAAPLMTLSLCKASMLSPMAIIGGLGLSGGTEFFN